MKKSWKTFEMENTNDVVEINTQTKKLGRAFNHLEDLILFYGTFGAIESLEHLKEFATPAGSNSIRMKWDGMVQIYWGRPKTDSLLVLAGHNGWARGAKTTSADAVEDFIANRSGSPKTQQEKNERNQFAQQFASLYSLFDCATPKDFQGFVYADALFLNKPESVNGIYSFAPNPKSQTCYHVKAQSKLGKKIAKSKVMIAAHAYFPQFGMGDHEQIAMSDFKLFDNTDDLIVLDPIYNSHSLNVDLNAISEIQDYITSHGKSIDGFLTKTKGLYDLKDILYRYVNQTARLRELYLLNDDHFFKWIETSSVSCAKQEKIKNRNREHNNALRHIFQIVLKIQNIKDDVINQLEKNHNNDIWDTNGEGRVRYADSSKQFGNIKLVPRKKWIPQ